MRSYYPRSFLKLLFVGFALIALPLMIALINNAISIDRLGNLSQKAVYQAVQATQSSRKLAELIPAMERAAHQMLILGDRSLLDTYRVHRKQLLATAARVRDAAFRHRAEKRAARDRAAAKARSTSCSRIPARDPRSCRKRCSRSSGWASARRRSTSAATS